MAFVAAVLLFVVHAIYRVFSCVRRVGHSFARRTLRVDVVAPTLSKTPRHVAVILARAHGESTPRETEAMVESATRAAGWCEQLQIPHLSVYDRDGILLASTRTLCEALDAHRVEPASEPNSSEAVVLHPLTPPPSETNSRAWTPVRDQDVVVTMRRTSPSREPTGLRKRRRSDYAESSVPLTIHVMSRDAGKPQLAAAARALADRTREDKAGAPTVEELDTLIYSMVGLPEVDLIVVHHVTTPKCQPLEMHGFPPWQMRLAEIYHETTRPFTLNDDVHTLIEDTFCRALCEYGRAEQRVGR